MAERTTSVAKDIHLTAREDAILETYGTSREAFDRAREDDPSRVYENAEARGGDGSQMVRDDRPSLDNRPPDEMARPVDREAFDERWGQEQERATADYERGDDYERG